MPLRAILRLAFNLLSPVVMFLFKWTALQLRVEVGHLRERENPPNKSSHHSVRQRWFGRDWKFYRDNNLHKIPPNLAPAFMAMDDETIHGENIFSIWATFRLRAGNQCDWQSSVIVSMLICSEIFRRITKDNPHWSPGFGCLPHCFLWITRI